MYFCHKLYSARAQPRLKSWGGPRFGSQHRSACAPRPTKGRARCWWAGCWVRERIAASRSEGLGYYPRKIFENSDAKFYALPQHVRNAPSLSIFRRELKTVLFRSSFPDVIWQCTDNVHNVSVHPPVAQCWSVTMYWLLQTDFIDIVRWSCSSSAIMPPKYSFLLLILLLLLLLHSGTFCEISCFLKTTAKNLGDQKLLVPSTFRLGDQSSPVRTVVARMVLGTLCTKTFWGMGPNNECSLSCVCKRVLPVNGDVYTVRNYSTSASL